MRKLPLLAIAVVLSSAPSAAPVAADAAMTQMTQSEVESRLACQCGCGLTVQSCDHPQCNFGLPVKADITASLAAGETGEDILARYMAEYGEKVLSSPTREGFNLLAWYGPYLALALGAIVVLVAVRRMSSGIEEGVPGDAGVVGDKDRPELRAQLERDLKDLDR